MFLGVLCLLPRPVEVFVHFANVQSLASFHSRTSYAPLLVTFTPTNLFLSLFISGNL